MEVETGRFEMRYYYVIDFCRSKKIHPGMRGLEVVFKLKSGEASV